MSESGGGNIGREMEVNLDFSDLATCGVKLHFKCAVSNSRTLHYDALLQKIQHNLFEVFTWPMLQCTAVSHHLL